MLLVSGELRRRLMSSVQTAQRHVYASPLHGCFPTPSRFVSAVSPSLVAFYTELLQRRRGLCESTASLAGRSQPSIVDLSTLIPASSPSFHCSSSRHLPFTPTVSHDAEDDEVPGTCTAAMPTTVSDSSGTLRKSLSADTNRYHPYEKTA